MDKEEILKKIETKERQLQNFTEKRMRLEKELCDLNLELEKLESKEKEEDKIVEAMTDLENYTGVIIFPEDTEEKEILEIENEIKTMVKFKSSEFLGKKILAYEIKGNKKGNYYEFKFYDKNGENMKKLDEKLRLNQKVLKHIIRIEND